MKKFFKEKKREYNLTIFIIYFLQKQVNKQTNASFENRLNDYRLHLLEQFSQSITKSYPIAHQEGFVSANQYSNKVILVLHEMGRADPAIKRGFVLFIIDFVLLNSKMEQRR